MSDPILIVPALIVVVPVNVFAPNKVSNPLPALVRIAALAPSAITPVMDEAEVFVTSMVP